MDLDGGDLDESSARVADLDVVVRINFIIAFWKGNELVTYKAAGADLERRSTGSNDAVSSSQDCVAIQQRSSAVVASVLLETDNEGEVTLSSGGSANNGLIGELSLRERGVLRNGCCGAEGGDRKSDEDIFDLHLE